MSTTIRSITPAKWTTLLEQLTHEPGHAVLAQNPDDEYCVIEFDTIVAPDDVELPDPDTGAPMPISELLGVLKLQTVSEVDIGVFEVDELVVTRQLPLDEVDDQLEGPFTPGSAGKLWTPGPANNYPLYEVERVADRRFEIA
jgi:hypothetical protein